MPDVHTTDITYPNLVILETTRYCNAKCVFCANTHMKRSKGAMERGLFEKIVQEISTWDVKPREINPTMYGEFFLNPEWKYYLSYISEHLPSCNIVLPTNGSCIDDKEIDFLVKIPNVKYISFSVYTSNPDNYYKVIGLPTNTIDKVTHAIDRLNKERPDITTRVGATTDTKLVPWSETLSLAEKFGNIVDPHEITRNHAYNDYHHTPVETKSCNSVFVTAVVLYDGTVVGCCYDPEGETILGDVKFGSLLDIWNGDRATKLRNLHASGERGEIPLCNSCSLVAR